MNKLAIFATLAALSLPTLRPNIARAEERVRKADARMTEARNLLAEAKQLQKHLDQVAEPERYFVVIGALSR